MLQQPEFRNACSTKPTLDCVSSGSSVVSRIRATAPPRRRANDSSRTGILERPALVFATQSNRGMCLNAFFRRQKTIAQMGVSGKCSNRFHLSPPLSSSQRNFPLARQFHSGCVSTFVHHCGASALIRVDADSCLRALPEWPVSVNASVGPLNRSKQGPGYGWEHGDGSPRVSKFQP